MSQSAPRKQTTPTTAVTTFSVRRAFSGGRPATGASSAARGNAATAATAVSSAGGRGGIAPEFARVAIGMGVRGVVLWAVVAGAVPAAVAAAETTAIPPSCASTVVRPLFGGNGWHRVQYNLEDAYCGRQPSDLYKSLLAPGARLVTENHYAGGLFTDLLVRGDAAAARRWLRAQLDDGLQGDEQAGGYTNYYRADVLAGLRWAAEHGDDELRQRASDWLRRSFALDALHVVPGSFEVAIPCSRAKLYNRDGRAVTLALLAGEED